MNLNSFTIAADKPWLPPKLMILRSVLRRVYSAEKGRIIMRINLTIFALCLTLLQVSAESFAQKVTLNKRDTPIEEVFQAIKKQTGYVFVYNSKELKSSNIDIHVKNSSIEETMRKCLEGLPFTFKIIENNILIKKENKKAETFIAPIVQRKEIHGKVVDEQGEPLPGVSIKIKDTGVGTFTNNDGEYTISVPDDAKIMVFSFIGFMSQEVQIGNSSLLNVSLSEEISSLNEVVVVGYGTQKKESVVGAIANLSNEALERRGGVSNLSSALSGQVPGVTVMETTGEPGRDDPQILIRGQSTWNGSQPLILVDGIERKMNDINVTEVASMSVLKDASATAVFGVKGANGVILITTKRGSLGKPILSFSANQSFKNISKIPEKLDAFAAQSWKNAAIENEISVNETAWQYYIPNEQLLRSKKPQVAPYTYLYPNIDWVDEITRDFAISSRYNMNVSGGTEFAKYFASVGYTHDGDIFDSHYNKEKGYDPGFAYDRFNFRGNLDFSLTKTTTLSTNINGYIGKQKASNADFGGVGGAGIGGATFGHIYRGLYELAPDAFPVKYPSGRYGKDPGDINMNNPIAILQEGGVRNTNRRHIGVDLKLDQKLNFITEGLSLAMNVAWDNYVMSNGPSIFDGSNQGQVIYEFQKASMLDARTKQDSLNALFIHTTAGASGINDFDFVLRPWTTGTEAVNNGSLERALFYQAGLNYSRTFNRHAVTGLFLFNRRENAQGAQFANYREDWVGRTTYSFNEKYFAELNGAYNGSEKFGPEYRFGFFPSAAIGWMISNEPFMQKYTWVDKLKIRGSIGRVGSDSGIPRWGYLGSWELPGNAWEKSSTFYGSNGTPLQYSPYLTYREGTIPNRNIRWETATKKNLGLEVSVLRERLTLDLDLFQDNRNDIFMTASRRNIPSLFGAAPVPANLGRTETKGYEIMLGSNKWNTTGLGYTVSLSMTRAKDVVLQSEDPLLLADYLKVVGFQIGQTKSQVTTGFLNNWDDIYASAPIATNMNQRLPGDWDLLDYNGDGVINTFDNVAYGSPQRPENTYNATLGINYKNLSFMVQFFAVSNITLQVPYVTPALQRWTAVSTELADYWTPNNPNATYKAPRLTTTSPTGQFGLYDGSFIRLKTVEIAYRLTGDWVNSLGISSARVTLNGNNLVFWSDLPMDRETGSFDIQNAYPMYRQFNVGIELSL